MTSPSCLEIVIVGCGFAGLACAIESKLKGHEVTLLEKHQTLDNLGDVRDHNCVISFAQNSGRIFERWGLGDRLLGVCTQHATLTLHDHSGEVLNIQHLPQKLFGINSYNGRRGEIHEVLLEHAERLGVHVRFGCKVVRYWEDEVKGKAGVVVEDANKGGEEVDLGADVVVGADGVRSSARITVLGYEDKPKSSGYAIYRAWFKSKEQGVDTDPLTKYFCENGGAFHGWVGKDVHMLAISFHNGEDVCWVLTHRDTSDIPESYSLPGSIDDALAIVDGWDPRCRAIISKAPSCVDWKLVYRDPLPTWVSKGGRIVLIGDAAHPFLPSSGQGASQGVEDGVTLAVTLTLAGKEKVPLGTRTFEQIRYNRVRRAQAMGESTRDKWHSAKYEKVLDSNGDAAGSDTEADRGEDIRRSAEPKKQAEASSILNGSRSSQTTNSESSCTSTSSSCSTNSSWSSTSSVSTSEPSTPGTRSRSASFSTSVTSSECRNSCESHSEMKSEAVKVELPFPEWLLNFDAEQHALTAYEDVAKSIVERGYSKPVLSDAW